VKPKQAAGTLGFKSAGLEGWTGRTGCSVSAGEARPFIRLGSKRRKPITQISYLWGAAFAQSPFGPPCQESASSGAAISVYPPCDGTRIKIPTYSWKNKQTKNKNKNKKNTDGRTETPSHDPAQPGGVKKTTQPDPTRPNPRHFSWVFKILT